MYSYFQQMDNVDQTQENEETQLYCRVLSRPILGGVRIRLSLKSYCTVPVHVFQLYDLTTL